MVIQLIYMGKSGYLAINGIKPDKDNPSTGEITIMRSPVYTEKHERYHIEDQFLITNNFTISMDYIFNFLASNDCFETREDGKKYIVLKEVRME